MRDVLKKLVFYNVSTFLKNTLFYRLGFDYRGGLVTEVGEMDKNPFIIQTYLNGDKPLPIIYVSVIVRI